MSNRMHIVMMLLSALFMGVAGCNKKSESVPAGTSQATSTVAQSAASQHHVFVDFNGLINLVGGNQQQFIALKDILGKEQAEKYQADHMYNSFLLANNDEFAVAVLASNGTLVLTSKDAASWKVSSHLENQHLLDFSVCNGTYVLLSNTTVSVSKDLVKWETFSAPADAYASQERRIACVNNIAVALQSESSQIYVSRAGGTWEHKTLAVPKDVYINDIAAGNGVFVAAGLTRKFSPGKSEPVTEPVMLVSSDAEKWDAAKAPENMDSVFHIVFGKGKFVALGTKTGAKEFFIQFSDDGKSWQPANVKLPDSIDRLSYNGDYFYVKSGGEIRVVSYDANHWGYLNTSNEQSASLCFEDYNTCFQPKPTFDRAFEFKGNKFVVRQPDELGKKRALVFVNGNQQAEFNIEDDGVDNAWVSDLDQDGNPEISIETYGGNGHYATLILYEWKDGKLTRYDLPAGRNGNPGGFRVENNVLKFTGSERSDNSGTTIFRFVNKRILEDEPSPKTQAAKSGSSSNQSASDGFDPVSRYANAIAAKLEKMPHPTCQFLASNIRTFGNSDQPDYVRKRQVDNLLGKAPSICAQ